MRIDTNYEQSLQFCNSDLTQHAVEISDLKSRMSVEHAIVMFHCILVEVQVK